MSNLGLALLAGHVTPIGITFAELIVVMRKVRIEESEETVYCWIGTLPGTPNVREKSQKTTVGFITFFGIAD